MSVGISAYIEELQEDGSWKLLTEKAISSNLKYILEGWTELPVLDWDKLSDGLKNIYKKDDDGHCYVSFRYTTLEELEAKSNGELTGIYTKLNMIVKALGVECTHTDDGEERDWGYGEKQNRGLTFQINKELVSDLQEEVSKLRNIGQREAFDLIASEYVEWGKQTRIVLAVS